MSSVTDKLRANLSDSIEAKHQLLNDAKCLSDFEAVANKLVETYRNGGRLYIAGNGGSAADAQHLATEFVAKLARPRAPLPAEALTVDSSMLTAIGNDFGFDYVFSRQIEGKMTRRDLFLAITTSGNSPNILKALETCSRLSIPSILLTGGTGGRALPLADLAIVAPGKSTSAIQEVHLLVYHTLCGCVEDAMFPLTKDSQEARTDTPAELNL